MKTTQMILLGLITSSYMALAQTTEQPKQETKVRVKKIEIVNGVEKTTDTTYTVKGPININKLDQLPNAGIPALPDLQEHLVITEKAVTDDSGKSDDKKRIIVFTNEIIGNEADSILIDDKLKVEIEHALDAAEAEGQRLKVDKTVCVTNSKEGKSKSRIEKIIIVKTSKVSDINSDESKMLGLNTTEQNKLLTIKALEVSPNPSTGKFNLKFELASQGDTQVSVLSPEGKTIYSELLKGFNGAYNKEIALGNQAAGIYFVKVQQNQKIAIKKLIIE